MTATAFVSEQFDEAYPPGIEHLFWTLARNRIVLREIRAVAAERGNIQRILDIGCGRGIALRYLRNQGIDCFGVEAASSPSLGDLTSFIRSGIDCFQIDARERAGYEALLLLDVLEHIADPVGFLRDVRAAYPNARALILTVPARKELWSNYDEHFGHFRRYTVETLAEELRASGFETIRSRYFFRALYPVMWGMRGHRTTTTRAPGNVALHRFMADCFIAEDRLLPGSIPGTSVIGQAW
jgi:SAM-dependent methyltransferase